MENTLPNLLGHIGYCFLALGTLLVARKIMIGWPLRMIGEVFWAIAGFMLALSSIWFWCILFLCLDVYGYYSWNKKQKNDTL